MSNINNNSGTDSNFTVNITNDTKESETVDVGGQAVVLNAGDTLTVAPQNTSTTSGSKEFVVTVTDANGNEVSTPVSVSTNGAFPAITSPGSGSSSAPASAAGNPWLQPNFMVALAAVMRLISEVETNAAYEDTQIDIRVRQDSTQMSIEAANFQQESDLDSANESYAQGVGNLASGAVSGGEFAMTSKNAVRTHQETQEHMDSADTDLDTAYSKAAANNYRKNGNPSWKPEDEFSSPPATVTEDGTAIAAGPHQPPIFKNVKNLSPEQKQKIFGTKDQGVIDAKTNELSGKINNNEELSPDEQTLVYRAAVQTNPHTRSQYDQLKSSASAMDNPDLADAFRNYNSVKGSKTSFFTQRLQEHNMQTQAAFTMLNSSVQASMNFSVGYYQTDAAKANYEKNLLDAYVQSINKMGDSSSQAARSENDLVNTITQWFDQMIQGFNRSVQAQLF